MAGGARLSRRGPPTDASAPAPWRPIGAGRRGRLASLLLSGRSTGFLRRPMMCCCRPLAFPTLTSAALRFHTSAQRIHQIDYFCWRALFRCFDLLTSLLFLQQLLKRILVMILELLRLQVARLGLDGPAP